MTRPGGRTAMPQSEKLERGARLRRLREALKWSQGDVASRAGKPEFVRESVAKIETGANAASSIDVQQCLARAFSIDVELMANYLGGRVTMEAILLMRSRAPVGPERSLSTRGPEESNAPVRDPVREYMLASPKTSSVSDTAPGPIRFVERKQGHLALEQVLYRIEWPDPFDVTAADAATAQARSEAFSDGSERPESTWYQRLLQLYRENLGKSKRVPDPVHDETPDVRDARELAEHKAEQAKRALPPRKPGDQAAAEALKISQMSRATRKRLKK